MLNLGDKLQLLDLLPVADITATGNGTGVDLQQLTGEIAIILDCKNVAGTTPTMDVTIEDSADNSSFAAVSPAIAFTRVTTVASAQKLSVDKDQLRRYIRAVKTIGGTSSPEYYVSVKAVGLLKYTA